MRVWQAPTRSAPRAGGRPRAGNGHGLAADPIHGPNRDAHHDVELLDIALPHRGSHRCGEVIGVSARDIGSKRQSASSGQRRQIGGGLCTVPRHLCGP